MSCNNDYCEFKPKSPAEIQAEEKIKNWLKRISSDEDNDNEDKRYTVQRRLD